MTDESTTLQTKGPLRRRWDRQVPLKLLFWRDLLVFGTVFNLAAAFTGLLALGFKAGLPLVLVLHALPAVVNVILVLCVWRTAELSPAAEAGWVRASALAWLIAVTVV